MCRAHCFIFSDIFGGSLSLKRQRQTNLLYEVQQQGETLSLSFEEQQLHRAIREKGQKTFISSRAVPHHLQFSSLLLLSALPHWNKNTKYCRLLQAVTVRRAAARNVERLEKVIYLYLNIEKKMSETSEFYGGEWRRNDEGTRWRWGDVEYLTCSQCADWNHFDKRAFNFPPSHWQLGHH